MTVTLLIILCVISYLGIGLILAMIVDDKHKPMHFTIRFNTIFAWPCMLILYLIVGRGR